MQTNKDMTPITMGPDVHEWDAVFDAYRRSLDGAEPQWFTVSWLFAECYMYRRVAEIFGNRLPLCVMTKSSRVYNLEP